MNTPEDFAEGRLKIECSWIALTKANEKDLVIHGPGEVWQDREGVLQYKIFLGEVEYFSLYKYLARPNTPGKIIPEKDYFSLEAHPLSGPIWTSDRVLPGSRGGVTGGFAHGPLYDLRQTRSHPNSTESAFIMCRYRGKLDFPCNKFTETVIRVGGQDRHTSHSLNAAFIDQGEYKFQILHENEHTFLSLQLPMSQLNTATPSRITEALQFVLAQQLALMVVETSSGDQFQTRLVSPSHGNGKLLPPLNLIHGESSDFWRMFINYFCYIQPNPDLGWHPISRHVASAIESTAASLETQVLALSVAVEGLAAESFETLAPVSADFLAELASVDAAIDTIELTDQTRSRIRGSLSAMRRPRNSDILRAFIAKSNLPKGLYASWSGLRHGAAHGAGGGDREFETILQLRGEVLSLFYSLLFATIGYSGPRSDYSVPGWPIQAWLPG
ncbi:MAG: hypothetical protein ACREIF_06670 [Chthoniobacterales bacterium]